MAKSKSNRLISLDEYILARYRSILNNLILQHRPEAVVIVPGSEEIKSVGYWEEGYLKVRGVVTYSVSLLHSDDPSQSSLPCSMDLQVRATLGSQNIDCEFERGYDAAAVVEDSYRRMLDKYLVPVINLRNISALCEEILSEYCPDRVMNMQPVPPAELADALGLEVVHERLYRMDHKRSVLILNDQFLPITIYDAPATKKQFRAGTIVINTAVRNFGWYEASCIAHECFHYAGQVYFNLLQSIAHRRFPSLGDRSRKIDPAQRDSIKWLEWQATIGSTFLRYPESLAKAEARAQLHAVASEKLNMGEQYEMAIRSIADHHTLPYSLVKRSLSFSGHTAAKGAYNYLNGGYIKPFAFDTSVCKGNATFCLSFIEFLQLCTKDRKIGDAVHRGALVYVDGHVCANSPEYVISTPFGKQLTRRALDDLDECCLIFYRKYSLKEDGEYDHGILTCDDRDVDAKSILAEICENNDGLVGYAFEAYRKVSALPTTFAGTVKMHRAARRMTQERLAEAADLDRTTIARIETQVSTELKLDTVIRLAIGLKLDQTCACDLFSKARFYPDYTPAGRALDIIITHLSEIKVSQAWAIAEAYYAITRSNTAEDAITLISGTNSKRQAVSPS